MSPYPPAEFERINKATASPYFKNLNRPEPKSEAEELSQDAEDEKRQREMKILGSAITSFRRIADWPEDAKRILAAVEAYKG